MKTLLLMRHAKSSWKDMSLSDHDRPLKKRGREAAPLMGELLSNLDLVPEIILCSTARRARQTVEYLLHSLPFEGEVMYTRDLYHSGPRTYLKELRQLGDLFSIAMIVGHNPGMEYAVEEFSGEWERMPTAAIARIDFNVGRWDELEGGDVSGKLLGVWRPREI